MSLPQKIDRYEILGLLATGGMAEVLLAKLHGAAGFERAVVVKRVLPHLVRQPGFREMFLDEASVVSGIHHPNVVQVHELAESGDELYLVMEYVQGESLSALAGRLRRRDEKLPYEVVAYIVAEAAAGLHAAHELRDGAGELRNVVHRDVSPHNIMVGYDGTVKVLDFGIAQAAGRSTQTESGVMKGKFAYMAPEQCFAKPLDRRTDIFALGVVLFEMITISRLFLRDAEIATVRAICDDAIPSPRERDPGCPEVLADACNKALARRPEDRFQDAAEMRRELVTATRKIAPESIAQELLAELMPRLFEDRYERKQEVLRRMKGGQTVTHIISADGVSAPALRATSPTEPTKSAIVAEPEPSSRRGTTALFAVAACLGLLALVGVGYLAVDLTRSPPQAAATVPVSDQPPRAEPEPPVEAAPEPEPAPAEAEAPPSTVRLRIRTDPPGATVRMDDAVLGETPLDVEVERSDEARSLRLERDGYATLAETVTPDADLRLRLSLTRARASGRRGRGGRAGAGAGGTPREPASGGVDREPAGGFFRFD